MGAGNQQVQQQRQAADIIYKAFDTNGDGVVSLQEFTAMFQKHKIDVPQSEYELAFFLLDANHNGSINRQEFQRLYDAMQKVDFKANFTDLIIFAADKNRDGSIDQKELLEICKYFKKPVPKQTKMTPKELEQLIKSYV